MKTIIISLLILFFCQPIVAQTIDVQLINNSKHAWILISQDSTFYVDAYANLSVIMPAEQNYFQVYALEIMTDESRIYRHGFGRIVLEMDNFLLLSTFQLLPIFIKNEGAKEITVEHYHQALVLSPGQTSSLIEPYVEVNGQIVLQISSMINGQLNHPEIDYYQVNFHSDRGLVIISDSPF